MQKRQSNTVNRPQTAAGGPNSSGHGAKSVVVRERAILALLSESTFARAAAKCRVGERTLRRWTTDDDEFKRDLAEARQAIFHAGMNIVQALAGTAVNTLAALMGPKAPPSVRLGAASTVLEFSVHQHDGEAILRKLEELEAHQRDQAALN